MRFTRLLLFVVIAFTLSSCGSVPPIVEPAPNNDTPPAAPREFRAMWIATVANIDWPSRRGLPVAQQMEEMRRIVQTAKRLNLNALILQVRPAADAIYASSLEPWSEYLSGAQGRAPEPFYDPLAAWVDMAHRNGLELHAWFNPYRARHSSAASPAVATHISRTHSHVVKTYGDQQWMDPGEREAAQRTQDVIADVVRRYDVDAVHVDDYFYPYPVKIDPSSADAQAAEFDFPDESSWRAYVKSGGKLLRADWRRDNVNRLIRDIYGAIHAAKPWVKFGVSPFGLGRPDLRPAGIEGFSQYDKLYADVELWLQEGWVDYLSPQLYWPMEQSAQAFPVLLRYWIAANTKSRHLWPGLFTSRINDTPSSWLPDEIVKQIDDMRSVNGAKNANTVTGHIHFSAIALAENRKGISDKLATAAYPSPALVPATPWLRANSAVEPPAPMLNVETPVTGAKSNAGDPTRIVHIDMVDRSEIRTFAIWARYGNAWQFSVEPAQVNSVAFPLRRSGGVLNRVVVAPVDRYGTSGPASALELR